MEPIPFRNERSERVELVWSREVPRENTEKLSEKGNDERLEDIKIILLGMIDWLR